MIKTIEELINQINNCNINGGGTIDICADCILECSGEGIHIGNGITINGNGSTIIGGETGRIFLIEGSDVEICNLNFKKSQTQIVIDAKGKLCSSISIHDCVFSEISCGSMASFIDCYSTVSDSTIEKLSIKNNKFIGLSESASTVGLEGAICFMNFASALFVEGEVLSNCKLSDVVIENNIMQGGHRLSLNIFSTHLTLEKMMAGFDGEKTNCVVEGVKVLNNKFSGSWDAAINIVCGCMNKSESHIENVVIKGNEIAYGVWGIIVIGDEPMAGNSNGAHMKNVLIEENNLTAADVAGEKQHAITVFGARTDYFPNSNIKNSYIEDVVIKKNIINDTDRGILVAGCDLFLDSNNCSIDNCGVKNIRIIENAINNTVDAFTFCGAYVEGRMFDWNIGNPKHNQIWGVVPIAEDKTYSAKGCYIENLVCSDNVVTGNRYKYRIHGVLAHGHGFVSNNTVKNAVIENNIFAETEGHIHVCDCNIDGWVQDDGENFANIDKIKL